jgi:hypothetical protein
MFRYSRFKVLPARPAGNVIRSRHKLMKPLKGEASRDYGDAHTDIARVVQDAHRALGEVGDYLKLCSRRLRNFGREPLLN